jgi:hypothetical protein
MIRLEIPLVAIFTSPLAVLGWRLARRARADRKRRVRRLEMELRLTDSLERFQKEVFRLKHYPVLRQDTLRRNAGLIPSTNPKTLRYIKGRQNED